MTRLSILAAALATLALPASAEVVTAMADTASVDVQGPSMQFSPELSGNWEGGGEVFVNMEQETPFNVKCDLAVDATDTTFSLDGECGALFVKRPIRVSLTREGETISGVYEADLRTGPASLTGGETNGAIEMEVEWGGEVNGDTAAGLRIVREGEEGLRIVFTDMDPATGEERTTSDLKLERG